MASVATSCARQRACAAALHFSRGGGMRATVPPPRAEFAPLATTSGACTTPFPAAQRRHFGVGSLWRPCNTTGTTHTACDVRNRALPRRSSPAIATHARAGAGAGARTAAAAASTSAGGAIPKDAQGKDVTLSGTGVLAGGGQFDQVKVRGTGTVEGDLQCSALYSSGAVVVEGSLATWTPDGCVTVNGGLKTRGGVRAGSLTVVGSAEVDHVRARSVHVRGTMKVIRNVDCETFEVKGGVSIGGDLRASKVAIEASTGAHRVRHIVAGRSVHIKAEAPVWYVSAFIPHTRDGTRVESITGGTHAGAELPVEVVVLDGVRADVVRARTVRLTNRCRIRRLEYSDSAEIGPDALVEELVQVSFAEGPEGEAGVGPERISW